LKVATSNDLSCVSYKVVVLRVDSSFGWLINCWTSVVYTLKIWPHDKLIAMKSDCLLKDTHKSITKNFSLLLPKSKLFNFSTWHWKCIFT